MLLKKSFNGATAIMVGYNDWNLNRTAGAR